MCALPAGVDLVILLEDAREMVDVAFVDVLHAKIVNDKGEADGAPIVPPASWCDSVLAVTCFVKVLVRRSCAMMPACGRPYIPHCTLQKTLPSASTLS